MRRGVPNMGEAGETAKWREIKLASLLRKAAFIPAGRPERNFRTAFSAGQSRTRRAMADRLRDREPELGDDVKRDMELIRRILLKIQARETVDPEHLEMEGVDDAVLGRHVELITRAA